MSRVGQWNEYEAKHYDYAEAELAKNDPPIPLAKIDCKEFNDTCKEFAVKKYPTMKIFRNGQFSSDYNGRSYGGRRHVGGVLCC